MEIAIGLAMLDVVPGVSYARTWQENDTTRERGESEAIPVYEEGNRTSLQPTRLNFSMPKTPSRSATCIMSWKIKNSPSLRIVNAEEGSSGRSCQTEAHDATI